MLLRGWYVVGTMVCYWEDDMPLIVWYVVAILILGVWLDCFYIVDEPSS